jgi:hypothetical protein
MGWASVMKSKPITLHRFLSAYHEPLIDTFARLAGEALAAVPGAKTIDAFVMSRASLRGDIVSRPTSRISNGSGSSVPACACFRCDPLVRHAHDRHGEFAVFREVP